MPDPLKPDRVEQTVEAVLEENIGKTFTIGSTFSWDNSTKHYRLGAGRKETPRSREVRAGLQMVTRSKVNMQNASVALRRGQIDLVEWQLRMAREIKNVHIAELALARGGTFNMTPADRARAAEMIRFQLEKLVNFAEQIKDGKVNLNQKRFLTRAGMYGDAGKTTYWQGVRQNSIDLGMTQERNVLGITEKHCTGCLDQTGRGWVPIGQLIPVGQRICLTNCLCNVIFRGPNGSYD